MRVHRDKHRPLEEVLAQHHPILRQEILKELGAESEAALKEVSERYLRQIAEAENARQELQERVEDREKRLEMEVQNVKVGMHSSTSTSTLTLRSTWRHSCAVSRTIGHLQTQSQQYLVM